MLLRRTSNDSILFSLPRITSIIHRGFGGFPDDAMVYCSLLMLNGEAISIVAAYGPFAFAGSRHES